MKPIDIVFKGPLGVVQEFIGVENGRPNIVHGNWYERIDGTHALRVMLTDEMCAGSVSTPFKAIGAEETIVRIPPSRDEIALEAMKIMLSEIYDGGQERSILDKEARRKSHSAIPKSAYAIADAMIEAASG